MLHLLGGNTTKSRKCIPHTAGEMWLWTDRGGQEGGSPTSLKARRWAEVALDGEFYVLIFSFGEKKIIPLLIFFKGYHLHDRFLVPFLSCHPQILNHQHWPQVLKSCWLPAVGMAVAHGQELSLGDQGPMSCAALCDPLSPLSSI